MNADFLTPEEEDEILRVRRLRRSLCDKLLALTFRVSRETLRQAERRALRRERVGKMPSLNTPEIAPHPIAATVEPRLAFRDESTRRAECT
jgi:hypothetical protein